MTASAVHTHPANHGIRAAHCRPVSWRIGVGGDLMTGSPFLQGFGDVHPFFTGEIGVPILPVMWGLLWGYGDGRTCSDQSSDLRANTAGLK